MTDILDFLTKMREEIDLAIIATSQGDDKECIKHADNTFSIYKELNQFYTEKIRSEINQYFKSDTKNE